MRALLRPVLLAGASLLLADPFALIPIAYSEVPKPGTASQAGPDTEASASAGTGHSVTVLTADQVVQILDDTVDWYRTLGAQQQTATEPSDLLILYANRQTADRVMQLAFEIARANAELLSSEADAAPSPAPADSSAEVFQLQSKAESRRQVIQSELDVTHRALAATPNAPLEAKLADLQGELDMVRAQKNLLDTVAQFVTENDPSRAGVRALKARIDAVAASIPAAGNSNPAPASASASPTPARGNIAPLGATAVLAGGITVSRLGLWDLIAEALELSHKLNTIDTIDRHTEALERTFRNLRAKPLAQLRLLSARSDELASSAETAHGPASKSMRGQFDSLAWLFTQTSAMLIPLSKEGVLLTLYRQNLSRWRAAVDRQYREVVGAVAVRAEILLGLLAAVFAAAEFWRRSVHKYVHEARRRYQLLVLRKVVVSIIVITIVGSSLITKLTSFATFAGLSTAGLAVAMQSVLMSVVGYFFLIGKYGIRVGDRVQIGNVTGEVIHLGLVRIHLMELGAQGPLGATGRVVAFANSIVFQPSGGLFRQLPGVNFAWHESTLTLPQGCDYAALKEKLSAALTGIVASYREEILRQAKLIQKTSASASVADIVPQVQLQFAGTAVDARIRYPVPLERAAQIDEQVSQELSQLVSQLSAEGPPAVTQLHSING